MSHTCIQKYIPSGMYHSRICGAKAVIGDYCKRHDPATVAAKETARHAKWEAEWAAERAKTAKRKEDARRAACFDQMLSALQFAYDRYGIKDVEAWERIRKAIESATGTPA